jgi:hypothetical protein
MLLKEHRTEKKKALLISFAQKTSPSQAKTSMTILATAVLEDVCVHISLRAITRKSISYTEGKIDYRAQCVRSGQRKRHA